MKLAGRIDEGVVAYGLDPNRSTLGRYNSRFVGQRLAKGTAYLDGLGTAGVGSQPAKLVVYGAESGALIATSAEVVVSAGDSAAWIDFPFRGAPGGQTEMPVGDFLAGLLSGGAAQVIRVYGSDPHGQGGKEQADTYADGPLDPVGAGTAMTRDLSVFLTLFAPLSSTLRPDTDLYYARLPLPDAQAIFGRSGPVADPVPGLVGWHDTFIDAETGSFALVREGGPFEGMLGERVRVTLERQSVVAYVHGLLPPDLPWDFSLARQLFARMAPLATVNTTGYLTVVS